MPPSTAAPHESQPRAATLLSQGRVVEASRLLSDAISEGESADLWNDWAVVQLGLAEHAFRRALLLEPNHPDAAANLGVLLFSTGRPGEAAVFLQQALATATDPARSHIQTLLTLCFPGSVSSPAFRPIDRAAILSKIRHVLHEYFRNGNRSPDVVTSGGFQPAPDSDPAWIEALLASGTLHDEDYRVFAAFRDPATTILDVGAHYGYSAASIWSSGAASQVLSFEVNPSCEPCLQRIAQLRPGRYDYCLTGVGDSPGFLQFAVPVINGRATGALTTACSSLDVEYLAKVLGDYFEKYFPAEALTSFLVHSFQSPIAALDDLLASRRFAVSTDHVAALKIDTEGLEVQVLAGARGLLRTQKPLILAETGHSNPRIADQLLPLGYVYARRDANQLQIASGPTTNISGFFLHPDHADEYRRIGLLQP